MLLLLIDHKVIHGRLLFEATLIHLLLRMTAHHLAHLITLHSTEWVESTIRLLLRVWNLPVLIDIYSHVHACEHVCLLARMLLCTIRWYHAHKSLWSCLRSRDSRSLLTHLHSGERIEHSTAWLLLLL